MHTRFTPQDVLEKIFPQIEERSRVQQALHTLQQIGAKPFLVGGVVRDLIINTPIKDVDIEVHGLPLDQLQEVLGSQGYLTLVGKSFGVLRWQHSMVDWSIPRRDFSGRKPQVELNPNMDIKQALRRRDLTINAMALDLTTGLLIDPFQGYQDLMSRTARTPDPTFFTEDPLRFYRVMQFIARFNLQPDNDLNQVCSTMAIQAISHERIEAEFDKLFLFAAAPSRGIRWIEKINRLQEVLPELAATIGVLQEHRWHPEGDVFEHSMQSLDAAADYIYPDAQEKLVLLSAALCHDLGKALTTSIESGRIRSIGHEEAGIKPTQSLMRRITSHKKRIATVTKLVRHHMAPRHYVMSPASDAAYRRLSVKLAPQTTMADLSRLAEADMRGRNPKRGMPLASNDLCVNVAHDFRKRAEMLGILYTPPTPVLTGADFLDLFKPGPLLGKAVERAYEIQIDKNITDKKLLKKRVERELIDTYAKHESPKK